MNTITTQLKEQWEALKLENPHLRMKTKCSRTVRCQRSRTFSDQCRQWCNCFKTRIRSPFTGN
jgi:hypothetical protein